MRSRVTVEPHQARLRRTATRPSICNGGEASQDSLIIVWDAAGPQSVKRPHGPAGGIDPGRPNQRSSGAVASHGRATLSLGLTACLVPVDA